MTLPALMLAALTAAVMAFTTAADASARTINVNPVSGNDSAPATTTQPLKTLGKALKIAVAGDKVTLAAGGYGPGTSGDQFPASGLAVRSGVTIEGATDGGFPAATLIGPGSGVGLNLTGAATVRNLALGGQGFGVGVVARKGTQTLSNLFLATASGRQATIDGLQFSAGIVLRGTARTTLDAGSTLFVNGATGVGVGQEARLTMRGAEVRLAGTANNGVFVGDQGQLTMDGGKITGGACGIDANGITLRDAAGALLVNGARLENVPGFGIFMHETATAGLADVRITRENCGGRPSIDARGSSRLETDRTFIASAGGSNAVGISTHDAVTAFIKNTNIHGHTGRGIDLNGSETLIVEASNFTANAIGIEARIPNDGSGTEKHPFIKVSESSLIGNTIAVQVDEPIFKLRNSRVTGNQTGIEVIGHVGGQPFLDSCFAPCVNLGFGTDIGNNTLTGNTDTAVRFRPAGAAGPTTPLSGVTAIGNVWNPNTQGSNGAGLYLNPLLVRVGDPLGNGKNFALPLGSNTLIQLGNELIGTFKLSPRRLPGRQANLKLAWTHPVDWKRLDEVMLLLTSRGRPVGRVVLDQDTRRLSAHGAVRLVPGRSTVSAAGKRVTAELAVRIAKRYAGRTLVAKVAASDDDGARQPFATAGRIRVTTSG